MILQQVKRGLYTTALLFITFGSYAESVTGTEYQAVIDTAYDYFEGAAHRNQTRLFSAFDTEFGHVKMLQQDPETGDQTLRVVSLEEFVGYFKQATNDTWEGKVLSVDIVDDTMAMVKLDFKTSKTHYIDYLVMYKRNGQWKIVNKTFVARPNN